MATCFSPHLVDGFHALPRGVASQMDCTPTSVCVVMDAAFGVLCVRLGRTAVSSCCCCAFDRKNTVLVYVHVCSASHVERVFLTCWVCSQSTPVRSVTHG